MSAPTHNLNIQNYSLEELLGLFDLTTYEISVDDLKRSKKKVLMLHPDKSKLDSKYFLFYKKAFDVIVQFYDNQHKHTKTVDGKKLVYTTHNNDNEDENRPMEYRVLITGTESGCEVKIVNVDGSLQKSDIAYRILNLLYEQLK